MVNGHEIRIWYDRWLPLLPASHLIPSGAVQVSRNTTVDSLINPATGDWAIEFLQPFISVEEVDTILATPIGDSMM